jgi:hypothetical protein
MGRRRVYLEKETGNPLAIFRFGRRIHGYPLFHSTHSPIHPFFGDREILSQTSVVFSAAESPHSGERMPWGKGVESCQL